MLYHLCGGKFQSWNADLMAAEKDAGLTGGSLSRQQAEYYYKGYPDNNVTGKFSAQKITRNGVFASFVQSNEDWLQFTKCFFSDLTFCYFLGSGLVYLLLYVISFYAAVCLVKSHVEILLMC